MAVAYFSLAGTTNAVPKCATTSMTSLMIKLLFFTLRGHACERSWMDQRYFCKPSPNHNPPFPPFPLPLTSTLLPSFHPSNPSNPKPTPPHHTIKYEYSVDLSQGGITHFRNYE